MNTRSFLQKITDKWPAKVLSLAAALIISVFYRLNTLETRVFTAPLKTEASPSYIPVEFPEHTIRITLRGETNNVLSISEDDIEAYIDLNKYGKEGTYRVPVQVRKIGNAIGVEPLEISVSPSEINITLEEKVSRYIHIFPVFRGNVSAGYEITNQSITPESLIAEGPRSGLDNLKEFTTEPIDLENRNRSFTMLVPVKNDIPGITIYGNRLIEYSCTIEVIERQAPVIIIEPPEEDEEPDENGETE